MLLDIGNNHPDVFKKAAALYIVENSQEKIFGGAFLVVQHDMPSRESTLHKK